MFTDPLALGEAYRAARDPKFRRAFGAHYTPESVVLRTLEPLFLDSLRSSGDLDRLASVRFLDPACGSGNFLVVAYRELRRLEASIVGPGVRSRVRLENFYGIEIDAGAARIASEALRLVSQQCDEEFASRFGIKPMPSQPARITVGNALTLDWASVCPPSAQVVVAGNPPFVGPKERSATQSAELRAVWGPRYSGLLDYVSGWYAKAAEYCVGDWAFVSTNSIVQGQGVPTLFGAVFEAGWRIRFAQRTFTWSSAPPWPGTAPLSGASSQTGTPTQAGARTSGTPPPGRGRAAVHCVIIGFTRNPIARPTLIDGDRSTVVPHINAYLVDGPDILVPPRRAPLAPDLPPVVAGSKAVDWGFLTVAPSEYASVAADPIAAEYLRPYRGGEELINDLDRWCLWCVGASLAELYRSPPLAARLDAVRARRLASPKAATRAAAATPHLFHERRQPAGPYLGIPQTFTANRSYATAGYLQPDVIASIKLFTAPDPDGFLFGVISSAAFLTWQKTVGGRMKSDPSFTNTVVWNTLPLPPVEAHVRQRIAAAGRAVLAARESGVSLAAQYAAMAGALTRAHEALDALVDDAFGISIPTEGARQRTLFARYAELTGDSRIAE